MKKGRQEQREGERKALRWLKDSMQESELVVEVYLDVLLLVNFIMDYFILWGTAKIAGLQRSRAQLMLGAFCGALYSLVVFFPQWPVLSSFLAKVACSLVMVWLAFRPLTLVRYLRTLAYLYGFSMAMGGAVLAAVFLLDAQPGSIQSWNGLLLFWGMDLSWLLVGLVVAFFLAYGGVNCLRKNWRQQKLLSELSISVENRLVVISALLDTGNGLIDPVSQKPVIIAEAAALKDLLPELLWRALGEPSFSEHSLYSALPSLPEEWQSRLSLIPYHSVGKAGGWLVGFKPDFVQVRDGSRRVTTGTVMIGLVNRALSREGHYVALLHPQILEDSAEILKDSTVEGGELKNAGRKNKDVRTMES
ncbi:MAG TPA: sigma-E processing peptidase SpoIIGA [Peptococcaceae bacterium]|nr:sigma-E processing peptidase SpoIIGA [Peptococcaceae bacterium]HQD54038.1 sigma-E processing peptidase SpoIIGA [Peptococcaceae bacterium]